MADITGQFKADFGPFEDAVKSAEITLKSFEADADKVQSSLERMGNSLSGQKIIQQAELMAEAIERAGGVTTLTANELARASSIAAEAAEKMRALGIAVPANIQALADAESHAVTQTDNLATSFTTLVTSMISAQAIIGAVKAVWSGLTDEVARSITAASEAEKAQVQLDAALRAQGTAIPSVITAYDGYAAALQKTTTYSDDALQASMALLVQVGNVMPRDMAKALDAATNLAAGLGKSLTDATLLVAKAANGNTTALEKSGIALDAAKVKTEGFGYVLDQITAKFGGQAAALAGTYQGRLEQLGNTWNNLEESIGRVITQNATVLTAIDLLNTAIAENTGELNDNDTANQAVSAAVIAVVRALALGVDAVGFTITAYYNLRVAADEVGAAIVNLSGYALDSVAAIMSVQKYYNPLAWTSLWKNAVTEVQNAAATMHGAAEGFHADSADALTSQERWATGLGKVSAGLSGMATKLESTAGQTKAFSPTLDGAADAWQRNTEAIERNKKAVEAAEAAWIKVEEETAKVWDDAFIARANLDTNSLASHLAVIEAKRQADRNEAERTIADADQLVDRLYAIDAKYSAIAINETNRKNTEIAASNAKLWSEYAELVGKESNSAYTEATNAIDRWYADTVSAAEAAGKANAEFWDAATKIYVEKWRQAGLDIQEINKTNQTQTQEGLQATADAARRQADFAITQVGRWSDDTIQKYRDAADAAQRAADSFGQSFTAAGSVAAAGIDKATAAVQQLHGQLNALVSDANDPAYFGSLLSGEASVARTIAAGKTHSPGEAAYMASGGVLSGSIGGGLIGYRAAGGPVETGNPYIVGEQGPELFIPLENGKILPNATSAPVTVTNVFHIVDTESNIARRVADSITRSVMRGSKVS